MISREKLPIILLESSQLDFYWGRNCDLVSLLLLLDYILESFCNIWCWVSTWMEFHENRKWSEGSFISGVVYIPKFASSLYLRLAYLLKIMKNLVCLYFLLFCCICSLMAFHINFFRSYGVENHEKCVSLSFWDTRKLWFFILLHKIRHFWHWEFCVCFLLCCLFYCFLGSAFSQIAMKLYILLHRFSYSAEKSSFWCLCTLIYFFLS